MAISIKSPYNNDLNRWLRGNLHAHTTGSDGARSPQAIVDVYAALGYDFLMISDHDHFTDPAELDPKGMVLIPGVEVTADGEHILQVNATTRVEPNPDRQVVIDAIVQDGGFAIVTHPNWESEFNHCPQRKLEAWDRYAGIEVVNGVCIIAPGSGYATDRWDMLLGQGRTVWGYGNDDTHRPEHDGWAWTMVQCAERSVEAIVDALRLGRCYASTGVTIDSIRIDGNRITISAPNAQRIIAISNFGRRQATADGATITFDVPNNAEYSYIRFECYGLGDDVAWTQPFFLKT